MAFAIFKKIESFVISGDQIGAFNEERSCWECPYDTSKRPQAVALIENRVLVTAILEIAPAKLIITTNPVPGIVTLIAKICDNGNVIV